MMRGLAVVLALVAAAAFGASPASAVSPPDLWQTPEVGQDANSSGPGELFNPRGLAADPDTGHIYVAEVANHRVSEFTSWGEFVKAWGWGVADGSSPELQTCGPGASPPTTACFAGSEGHGAGQFNWPQGVTVDANGDLYVAEVPKFGEGSEGFRVQKFTPSGEFILMFGREVNKTTSGDLCTAAGDVCGAGLAGTGDGQFDNREFADFIETGPAGTVFVGDKGRIQEFNADGTFKAKVQLSGELSGKSVEALALGSTGSFYVALGGMEDVRKLSPAGALTDVLEAPYPSAVAVDARDHVYVADDAFSDNNENTVDTVNEVLEFDAGGDVLLPLGSGFASPPAKSRINGLATNLLGDGSNAAGDIYTSVSSLPNNNDTSYVKAFGPIPRFDPPPLKAPLVKGQFAAKVGSTSAVVKAQVNPRFYPLTTYYVEYGLGDCDEVPCAKQPLPPGLPLGFERNAFVSTSGIVLSGLQPGTTYHYRFVAVSGALVVKGEGGSELGGIFATYRGGAQQLPDGRAFEMVSPLDKNSGEVGAPGRNTSGIVTNSVAPHQAAQSGEAMTYTSFTSFGSDPQSAPAGSQYLSTRGAAGWSTANITPADRESFLTDPLRGFSPDLGKAAVIQLDPPLVEGAPVGFENLYVRDNVSGSLELVTFVKPKVPVGVDYCVGFAGATAGFEHVFFTAKGKLTSDAPMAPGQSLYEWSASEGLSLVSVLPSGTPATPSSTTAFGAKGNECAASNIVRNAISANGSRIFWTLGGASPQLLARVDGSQTIALDDIQGGTGPAGGGQFWAASRDGSKVFFTAAGKLTPGAGSQSLYLYDFDAPEGSRLSAIATAPGATDVKGVLGAGDDGAYVYFTAGSALDGGAVGGQNNLYLWHRGEGVRFIATLQAGLADLSNWNPLPRAQTARVSPDGRHLAFVSAKSLTGYENRDQATGQPVSEAFLYDALSEELICASCNPTGALPIGGTELPTWSTPYEQPRSLSDDGGRLYFMSSDALALRDSNGAQDVYQYERTGVGGCSVQSLTFSASAGGCIDLISTGSESGDAQFLDASSDGRDVFFSTPQRLVAQDEDERYDIYDARIGGGFAPPAPVFECSGESCRPSAPVPAPPSPTSSSFQGAGNVPEAKRKKQKKKKAHGKKGKGKGKKQGKSGSSKKSGGSGR